MAATATTPTPSEIPFPDNPYNKDRPVLPRPHFLYFRTIITWSTLSIKRIVSGLILSTLLTGASGTSTTSMEPTGSRCFGGKAALKKDAGRCLTGNYQEFDLATGERLQANQAAPRYAICIVDSPGLPDAAYKAGIDRIRQAEMLYRPQIEAVIANRAAAQANVLANGAAENQGNGNTTTHQDEPVTRAAQAIPSTSAEPSRPTIRSAGLASTPPIPRPPFIPSGSVASTSSTPWTPNPQALGSSLHTAPAPQLPLPPTLPQAPVASTSRAPEARHGSRSSTLTAKTRRTRTAPGQPGHHGTGSPYHHALPRRQASEDGTGTAGSTHPSLVPSDLAIVRRERGVAQPRRSSGADNRVPIQVTPQVPPARGPTGAGAQPSERTTDELLDEVFRGCRIYSANLMCKEMSSTQGQPAAASTASDYRPETPPMRQDASTSSQARAPINAVHGNPGYNQEAQFTDYQEMPVAESQSEVDTSTHYSATQTSGSTWAFPEFGYNGELDHLDFAGVFQYWQEVRRDMEAKGY